MIIKPPTYPARPSKGGPPHLHWYDEDWSEETKANGWRVMVHTPSSTAFNRMGEPISIGRELVPAMLKLKAQPFEWLDCEALSRRHQYARGTLLVLDWVVGDLAYHERRLFLSTAFPVAPLGMEEHWLRDWVYLVPELPRLVPSFSAATLQERNRKLGCTFYEGTVAKRRTSYYPMQLRSPEEETPHWVKHRFTTS